MKKYDLLCDESNKVWMGEDPEGEYLRIEDVIEALEDINCTCSDRAYEDISELIDALKG